MQKKEEFKSLLRSCPDSLVLFAVYIACQGTPAQKQDALLSVLNKGDTEEQEHL